MRRPRNQIRTVASQTTSTRATKQRWQPCPRPRPPLTRMLPSPYLFRHMSCLHCVCRLHMKPFFLPNDVGKPSVCFGSPSHIDRNLVADCETEKKKKSSQSETEESKLTWKTTRPATLRGNALPPAISKLTLAAPSVVSETVAVGTSAEVMISMTRSLAPRARIN